jgi:hypothetical protein
MVVSDGFMLGSLYIRDSVGLRASLDKVAKRKFSLSRLLEWNSGRLERTKPFYPVQFVSRISVQK